MIVQIPSGSASQPVKVTGRFFDCRSASKPFDLRVVLENGNEYTIEKATEGTHFSLPKEREFVLLDFIKTDRTDTDQNNIVITALPFEVGQRTNRIPPVSTNPFSTTQALASVGDKAGPFGGFDTEGKRRMKATFQYRQASATGRVGIFKGGLTDADDNANLLFELAIQTPVWSEFIDTKVTLKVIAAVTAGSVIGYEANQHP